MSNIVIAMEKIVYSAYKPDSRWGWRNYGEIRLLDVKSGKQQTITHRTKYFTPILVMMAVK
jgi:hypothetical protein